MLNRKKLKDCDPLFEATVWARLVWPCEKRRRIRELTSLVEKRFRFPQDSVELYVEKVANRGLCAIAQAESLRYKLLGGLAVCRSLLGFEL
ncbi:hypothetical protein Bca4012_050169 [Brassica carinata]